MIAAVFVIVYMFITGFSPSVVRAAIMYLLYVWGKSSLKGPDSLSSLGLAALALLIYNPIQVFMAGFQLSFCATAAILLLSDRIYEASKRFFIAKAVNRTFAASAAVQIGIFPIQAAVFNTFPALGILCNILISPFAAVVITLGQVTAMFGVISIHLARLIAFMLATFLAVIKTVASIFAAPFFIINTGTPGYAATIGYYLTVFIIFNFSSVKHYSANAARDLSVTFQRYARIAMRGRFNRTGGRSYAAWNRGKSFSGSFLALLTVTALTITIFIIMGFGKAPGAEVTFIDIGNANASYVKLPDGSGILFDAGGKVNFSNPKPAPDTKAAEYLAGRGVREISLAVLSHGDYDHIGGMRAVIDTVKVGAILVSGAYDENTEDLLDYAAKKNIEIIRLWAGDSLAIGSQAKLEVLSPSVDDYPSTSVDYVISDLNEASLVTRLVYKDMEVLYCGDIGKKAESMIINRRADISADIIIVPHHGSKNSSGHDFIKAVRPAIAVFEVGKNSYGHPNADVVSCYENFGAAIVRTDIDGSVKILYDEKNGYRIDKYNSAENQYGWMDWLSGCTLLH
jgi:competence protein ComEC